MLNYLITGISLGSIYAIIALGYTMVYGIAKMLNFAHGDVIMVGGYMCFCATAYLGWNPLMGVLLAIVVCTVLGVVIERLAYKPLRNAPALAVLITAIGVSYFLQNAALLIWTSTPVSFTSVVGSGSVSLGTLRITHVTLVTIAVCILIMVVLMLFTSKTKNGYGHARGVGGQGSGTADGDQCEYHYFCYICHRFGAGSHRGCADALGLSAADSHNRFHAWHQGIYCCGIRRHRLDPRCVSGRYPAGCD